MASDPLTISSQPHIDATLATTDANGAAALSDADMALLAVSVALVALCGIAYELAIAATSSYLVGNSVLQFSTTIGLFMFGMGVGSYVSRYVDARPIVVFVWVETVLAIVGGVSTLLLFTAYSALAPIYGAVMYAYAVTIGALVGVEIPLLLRVFGQRGEIHRRIADVLSLDYVGALIGAVAFPLLLLPGLGLLRSVFVVGAINALVGLVAAYRFDPRSGRVRWTVAGAWFALILLVVLTLLGTRLTAFAEDHLYRDLIVLDRQSPYQRIVVTRNEQNGEHRLYLDGHLQFAGRDEHRYHEALVHPVMSVPGARTRVLVLGGGDGLAVRELLRYPDVRHIDLVDIDPTMAELARQFAPLARQNDDALDDARVRVIAEDAFAFVRRRGPTYDRVIVDLPDPHAEVLNKLYSLEFYKALEMRLSPTGAIVTQATSPFLTRCTFWSIGATMAAAGLRVVAYQATVPSFGVWGFQLAARAPPTLATMRIGVPTRFLTPEALARMQVFEADIQSSDCARVNSFYRPSIYLTYALEVAG